jgi:hypothetical protein
VTEATPALVAFGTYCRRMATAVHVDDCASLQPPPRPRWRLAEDLSGMTLGGFTPSPPPCPGCVTASERDLWDQLAQEVEAYLAQPSETGPGLF